MKVQMISHTENPELVIATAAKLCYAGCTIEELMYKQTPEMIEKFIKKLMSMGHESPLEHVSFTFAIEGVSRITEQQLTRHRIASYSIQSGRYVNRKNAEFYTPSNILEDDYIKSLYDQAIKDGKDSYEELSTLLTINEVEKELIRRGVFPAEDTKEYDDLTSDADYMIEYANSIDKSIYRNCNKKAIESARCIFPNSLETRIVCTMNARSLLNFFSHRCCFRAQEEIRELANKMLIEVKKIAPILFKNAGATCKMLGYCPEGDMQCEQLSKTIPTLKELFLAYNKMKN